MNQSFFKIVLSHALKYFTGSIITSGIALLMTKYYTSVFTPSEFGILALYLVMFKYVTSLVSLNLDSNSTRFYFDYRESRRDEYLSTMFWFITLIAIVVLVFGLLFMKPISNWIAPNSESTYLITLISGIGAVYVSYLTRILYNEHASTSVLKHSIFQTLINHASSFLFISIFHLGIFGRISGQGLGYFLNIFTLLKEFTTRNLFHLKLIFNKTMASETFILTFPTIISMFLSVALLYLDRIFLKHYIGDSAVGIYTLGYTLGQGLSIVYDAVSQAILPKVFKDMNENYEKAKNELERFSYIYYIGLILITVSISLLSDTLITFFSNDNYRDASGVIPFIMAGFMMGGFYKIPSLILGYHKVVWFYPFLVVFSFGINALMNWWLIPIYGMIGASFSSFIGFGINSFLINLLSMKYLSIRSNVFVVFIYLLSFLAVCILFMGKI